jgi:hypothetical protein
MSVALNKGPEVTALQNHFFFDEPKVYFMHIGGDAPVDKLAAGVRAIFEKVKEIRAANAQPTKSFGSSASPEKSSIDGAVVSQVFGQKGDANKLRIYDSKSMTVQETLGFGGDADNVRYDEQTGNIWVGYGNDGIAIANAAGQNVGSVALDTHPESFQFEPNGD